jgi:ubiquinol-cytochrome c reductase cytochrome b subunit
MRRMWVNGGSRTDPRLAPFRRADGTPWGSGLVGLVAGLRTRPAGSPWPPLVDAMALGCLVVLIVTGVALTAFYTPSSVLVRYQGSYPQLSGVEMSEAYASTLALSFDVPGGLLLRQAHHWAALLLPAVLMIRLLIAFFSGAFRRPRRVQWLLLVGAYLTALLGGWSGYALPDDLLAGTGLRIFQGVVLGIPVVGSWMSLLIFGGEYPGDVLARLYPVHVIIAPVLLLVLLVVRFWLASRAGSPVLGDRGRSDAGRVVPWWPRMAVRCIAMLMITVGLIVIFGGLVQISPVWRQGPSSPGAAGAGSQPDWYTAFLDGALRLVPPGWELTVMGHTLTLAVLVPLVLTGSFILVILTWPLVEETVTGDHACHDHLDRARDVPVRTGLGAAGLVFYGTLWAAGSADLIATEFAVSFNAVITMLQVILCLGPPLAFVITRLACGTVIALEEHRRAHGVESGVIVRLPSGGYVEAPLTSSSRSKLLVGTRALEVESG